MSKYIEVDGVKFDEAAIRRLRGLNNGLDTRCQAQAQEITELRAKMERDQKQLLAAVQKWEEAFDGLFGHCLSKGIFNA